jgi:hypothetical protein
VRTLPESTNSYKWLKSTFLSYPTTFLTFQRTISSTLLAKLKVVEGPKSHQARRIVCRLLDSSNSYMWLGSTFLSYPTTFLTFQRTISSRLLAKVEVVHRPGSYQVDVLCVDYLSHLTVTCGNELLFSRMPLLPLLFRGLYHPVSLPQ